jgi:hypothetical protein
MPVQPVAADIQCNTGRPVQAFPGFAGTTYKFALGNPTLVESQILEERPHVWPIGSDVYAWTMLTRPAAANGNLYWTQIGWQEHRSSSSAQQHYTFYSWTDANGHFWNVTWAAAAIGSSPNYITTYDPATSDSILYRDTKSVRVHLGWTPTTSEVEGEIHDLSDQMPGGTSQHVTFRNTKVAIAGGTPALISSAAGASSVPAGYYTLGASRVGSGSYDIWDNACNS